jgi:hypothetical protein
MWAFDEDVTFSLPEWIDYERNSADLDDFLLSMPEDDLFDSEFVDTVSRSW